MLVKTANTITIIILTIMALISVALIGPPIFGYRTYAVLSGSMEPTLPMGSIAYVKSATPDDILMGDIITYTMANNSSKLVTHRVIEIDPKKKEFITQGDANVAADGPISFHRLTGRMCFNIPYLGFVTTFLKTKGGLILAACTTILIFVLTLFLEMVRKQEARAKH